MSGHDPDGASEQQRPRRATRRGAARDPRQAGARARRRRPRRGACGWRQALRPWFGVAKVGLELYSAAGPDAIATMRDLGYRGVRRPQAARHPHHGAAGRPACWARSAPRLPHRSTPSAASTCSAPASRGSREGAAAGGCRHPSILAVTVLTSDGDAPAAHPARAGGDRRRGGLRRHRLRRRRRPRGTPVRAAAHGACVPGIRPGRRRAHDQARVVTPTEALEAGADLLVIGRAVTQAADPAAAAAALVGRADLVSAPRVGSATGFRTLTGLLH